MTEAKNERKELNDSNGSTPCPKCGDTWKWPHTDKCYSCEEEKLYKQDCADFNTKGWSATHGSIQL